MKKIIITDFDDTIYVNGKIRDNDINYIKKFKEAGNLLVIATGSSYSSFKAKSKGYDLEYDYLIVNHGTTIYKNEDIIYSCTLDKNILNEIIKRYNLDDDNNYIMDEYSVGNFFSSAKEGLVSHNTLDITKVHLEFNNNYKEEVKYLRSKYSDKINIYELLYNNDIEIISNKCSKLIAISKIIEMENIKDENIYTIGDGYSDIDMIRKYNGYAVDNAIPKVKEIAVKVVASLSELIKEIL